jgi:branched-chain amino acid transport system ATP-binding protein
MLFDARDIQKRFGSRVVLENISLSFAEGHVYGIMGPNGAGKTTCFNVLTGLHAPDRGSISLDGRDITGLPPQRMATIGVSRSFQIMSLFDDMLVVENVVLALPAFRQQRRRISGPVFKNKSLIGPAIEVLDQVGLAHRAWDKATSLSYGERRALEIAIALAAEPRILFLDEPTSGLGSEGTRNLVLLIEKLRRRYTIVMIEHDMHFLFGLADRISVIHWGQVIAEGTPDALKANEWVARSALGTVA